jgi:hypothetical protein
MTMPQYVEIETSRLCNRRCRWCPNHGSADRTVQELMEWSIYMKVLGALAERDYNGWIAFHNYNEPLVNPRLIDEVREARRAVPRARLTVYTNGDMLTAALFGELCDAGLSEMRITLYPQRATEVPSYRRAWDWVAQRPFLPTQLFRECKVRQGVAVIADAPFIIKIISPDVSLYWDRGGTLPALSIAERTLPCFLTSHSLSIDHSGHVKMCCNVVSGWEPHNRYILASVERCNPLDEWESGRFVQLRKLHLEATWTESPICLTCRQDLPRT